MKPQNSTASRNSLGALRLDLLAQLPAQLPHAFALRSGADAICEKLLVLNPWNIDGITEIEQETGMDK